MKFKWLIPFLLIPVLSFAQHNDRDSLVKLLSTLKDSTRIDCLNKLSTVYYINALNETYENVQTDSATFFASIAYDEALKINYDLGLGVALQNLGEITRDRGNYNIAENYFKRSIPLFQKVHATEKYSWAHITMGWCLHKQCKFSAARLAFERAMPYYIKSGNKERQSMVLRMISYTYGERGYNEKAFEYMLQALRITYEISDVRGVISSPRNIGNFYKDAGDTVTALVYLRLAAFNALKTNPVRHNKIIGDIAMLIGRRDSAIFYYNAAFEHVKLMTKDTAIRNKELALKSVSVGEVYLVQHAVDAAIKQFTYALYFFEHGYDINGIMKITRELAWCYQLKQQFTNALAYSKRLLFTAEQTGDRPFIRDPTNCIGRYMMDKEKQTVPTNTI